MKRYQIALVVDHFLPRIGGIETQVSQLAQQLRLAGHEVTVVTTTPGPNDQDGVRVERLPARLIPKYQVAWTLGPVHHLRQVLQSQPFDVVHCHSSIYSPLAYSGLVLCQQLHLPSMLTVHSVVRRTSKIFNELDRFFRWRNWPTLWSTVSRFNAELMRRNARLAEVHVVPNGIDVQQWRTPSREHRELRVASVLRLNHTKRPHDLVRAIARILQRWTTAPIRFSVIGQGPLRRSTERLADKLNVAHAIEFLGPQSPAAIREVLACSHLFLHPTPAEAFGIAVLEALAAGLPVVARAGCGVSDLVTQGHEGFLASDLDSLAEYTIRLLDDAALRRQMSTHAHQAAERFDWQISLRQHLDLYQRAVELRRSSDLANASRHAGTLRARA